MKSSFSKNTRNEKQLRNEGKVNFWQFFLQPIQRILLQITPKQCCVHKN